MEAVQPQKGSEKQVKHCENIKLGELCQSDAGSTCNYCHKGKYYTWGLIKTNMQPRTYELMMERGWRRCGDYYYKVNMAKSCCQQWTHRMDVSHFKIKKAQRKCVRKLLSLVSKSMIPAANNEHKLQKSVVQKQQPQNKVKITLKVQEKYQSLMKSLAEKLNAVLKTELKGLIPKDKLVTPENPDFSFQTADKLRYFSSQPTDKSDYYCNYVMLLYGLNKKQFQQKEFGLHDFAEAIRPRITEVGSCESFGVDVERGGYLLINLSEKLRQEKSNQFQIIEFENMDKGDGALGKMEHKAQNKKEQKAEKKNIIQKIKDKIMVKEDEAMDQEEEDEPEQIKLDYQDKLHMSADEITLGKLTVKVVPVDEDSESWKLYQQYCQAIHQKPEKSMSSYISFLCTKGLQYQEHVSPTEEVSYQAAWEDGARKVKGARCKKMGCFHMKYLLEGRLIGVGVVDVVPDGLSSVYYFYDPALKPYRLGVFSTLVEIEYVRFLRLSFPEFKYYYMGFYLQRNQKMDYKVDYTPCQLLCPVTLNFVDFTPSVKAKIDTILDCKSFPKDVRLSEPESGVNPDLVIEGDIGVYIDRHIEIKYQGQSLSLKQINPRFFVPILNIMKQYLPVWGKTLFDIFSFSF